MDDIQDYWIQEGQITPTDIFISKNQSLSLGLIMNSLGNDSKIINTIREGIHVDLFELAIHGWNHTDYTDLSEEEQKNSLYQANKKMETLFGNTSDIFIPPEYLFNNATLNSMNQLGFRILSSALDIEHDFDQKRSIFVADGKTHNESDQKVFHLPATVSFNDYIGNNRIENSIENILSNITRNIETNGYAVIVLHPQDFMKLDVNGSLIDTLDENKIKDLSHLVDSILSKNIDITSFSKVAGIEPKVYVNTSCLPDYPAMSNDTLNFGASDRIPLKGLEDVECSMAEIYNRYGKYIYQKASEIGVSPSAAAAVLFVESRGSGFGADGRMTIRFEACAFYDIWGKKHIKEFSEHFQCDSPNDKFRTKDTSQFIQYHGNHSKEWEAFELAKNLSEEEAIMSISMGLAQIMGFNYDKINYGSPKEMFNKMSADIKSQLDGFFLFLQLYTDNNGKSCLEPLKVNNYEAFAACYNAANQNYIYGSKVLEGVKVYKEVTAGRSYADS